MISGSLFSYHPITVRFTVHENWHLPLYGKLGARSLTLEPELNASNENKDSIVVGKYPEIITPFTYAVPLQLLAFFFAKAKGLDVDEWCGGKRTKQIIELSIQTIRNSEII
ncbi:MAG: hypothetical protein GTN76_02655 [Candidatus Aenigmarchaeota archaeon]|nr:hypothetical protein [Candidatus Aenigmarchaeota archaeon]